MLFAHVLDRLQFGSALAADDEQQLLERLFQNEGQSRATERKRQAAELQEGELQFFRVLSSPVCQRQTGPIRTLQN